MSELRSSVNSSGWSTVREARGQMDNQTERVRQRRGRKLVAASAIASLTFTGLGSIAFAADEQAPEGEATHVTVPETTTTTAAPTTTTTVPEEEVEESDITLPPLPSTIPPVPTSVTVPTPNQEGEIVVDTMFGTITASCTSTGHVAIQLSNPKMGLQPVNLTLDANATVAQVLSLARTFNISTDAIEVALSDVSDCSVDPAVLNEPSQPPAEPGGISGSPMADIDINCVSDGTVDVKLINPTLVPRVFSVLVGDVQVANPTVEPGTSPMIKIDMAEDATAVVTVQVGVLEIVNTVEMDCLLSNKLPLSLLNLFNTAGTTPPAVLGTTVTPAAATLPRTGSESGLVIAAGLALAALGLVAGRAARQAKMLDTTSAI